MRDNAHVVDGGEQDAIRFNDYEYRLSCRINTCAPVKRTWGMSRQITATHVQHLDVCAPPPAVNSQPRSLMAFARRLWVGDCAGVGRAHCLWKIYRITHVRRRNKHKHGVHVHALCTNTDKLFGRSAFGEDCVLPNLHRVPIGSVILLLALETHKVTPVIEIALSWAKSISETRSPHPRMPFTAPAPTKPFQFLHLIYATNKHADANTQPGTQPSEAAATSATSTVPHRRRYPSSSVCRLSQMYTVNLFRSRGQTHSPSIEPFSPNPRCDFGPITGHQTR